MLGPGQQQQVSPDDDAVETVINKNQGAFKELRRRFPSVAFLRCFAGYENHLSWRLVESTKPLVILRPRNIGTLSENLLRLAGTLITDACSWDNSRRLAYTGWDQKPMEVTA